MAKGREGDLMKKVGAAVRADKSRAPSRLEIVPGIK